VFQPYKRCSKPSGWRSTTGRGFRKTIFLLAQKASSFKLGLATVDYTATLLQAEQAIGNDKGEKDASRGHMVIEAALKEACQDAEFSLVCLPVYCILA
jgi:hypothetical protein